MKNGNLKYGESFRKRFWGKVEFIPFHGCWEWVGAHDTDGYGRIGLSKKTLYAHRISYELHRGDIPDGLLVCHRCDNRQCINPDHLFLGTNRDNIVDASKKGRLAQFAKRGENHPMAKLSNLDVQFIRVWLSNGYSQRSIARAFNVTQTCINDINRGRKWAGL
jgi:hypothetical protein